MPALTSCGSKGLWRQRRAEADSFQGNRIASARLSTSSSTGKDSCAALLLENEGSLAQQLSGHANLPRTPLLPALTYCELRRDSNQEKDQPTTSATRNTQQEPPEPMYKNMCSHAPFLETPLYRHQEGHPAFK
eukprot:126092-Pelagomonas_calceolata.AAC.9